MEGLSSIEKENLWNENSLYVTDSADTSPPKTHMTFPLLTYTHTSKYIPLKVNEDRKSKELPQNFQKQGSLECFIPLLQVRV